LIFEAFAPEKASHSENLAFGRVPNQRLGSENLNLDTFLDQKNQLPEFLKNII
jgi:hypothetical protein